MVPIATPPRAAARGPAGARVGAGIAAGQVVAAAAQQHSSPVGVDELRRELPHLHAPNQPEITRHVSTEAGLNS